MNRQKISFVFGLMLLLACGVYAQTFKLGIYVGGNKQLTMGMDSKASIAPFPPGGPAGEAMESYLYLEAAGNPKETTNDTVKCNNVIVVSTTATTWKMVAQTVSSSMSYQVKLESGSLSSGKLTYREALGGEAVDLSKVSASGLELALETGKVYLFAYTKGAEEAPIAENIEFSALSGTSSIAIPMDTPAGYTVSYGTCYGFKVVDGKTALIKEGYGKVQNGKYVQSDWTDKPVMVKCTYWLQKGGKNVAEGLIIINIEEGFVGELVAKYELLKGLAPRDITSQKFVVVDPSSESYDGTELVYNITVDDASVGKALTLNVKLPYGKSQLDDEFPYAIDCYVDGTALARVKGSTDSDPAFTIAKAAATMELTMIVKASSGAESANLEASLTNGTATSDLPSVGFIVLGGSGTLDFNEDGNANNIDTLFMQNYLTAYRTAGGEIGDITVDDMVGQTALNSQTAEQVAIALKNLNSLAASGSLNFDCDAKGNYNNTDLILYKNFVVAFRTSGRNIDDITAADIKGEQGATANVDGEAAWALMKKFAANIKSND